VKLITLNIWGAQVKKPFVEFVERNKDVDIFCLQEVYDKAENLLSTHYPNVSHSIFTELQTLLPEHQGFFRPVVKGVYGIAIFIKKAFPVLEEGEILIHRNDKYSEATESSGHHSRNLQWIKFGLNQKNFTVFNVHGLWNGMGKTDTPARLAQSKRIKEFVDTAVGPKILCGDFNLRPDTKSIALLEGDMRNLIKEYAIQSTRTSIYGKEEKYADYVFVSPEIEVRDFKVLPDEVSDHAALFLEI
jgi:endonuclease/exonuclease/phosphatase family metal-dependent hydrolase